MALSLIGSSSIEAYIDLQKLKFLDSILRLYDTCIVKQLFLIRYFQYSLNCTSQHIGFVPDLANILRNILHVHFENFLMDGQFESKLRWKKL